MTRAALLCAFLAFAVATPAAHAADFGIVPGSLVVRALDAEGNPENRAGAHPDRLQIDFALSVEGTETSLRDLVFELPPGLGGYPDSVPECPRGQFEAGEECSEESRVGTLVLEFLGGGESSLPVFQLEPEPGEVLAFGSSPGFDVPLEMELRPEDFGITLAASDLSESPVVSGARAELWGVPADRQSGTAIPRRPFLTLPPRCGPLEVTLRARSWLPDAGWSSATAESDPPLAGCQELSFAPQLELELDDPAADAPTGAAIDLRMPEDRSPDGQASAQLEAATIELPPDLTVSPGGAVGLTACGDARFGLGDADPASCPASSRVGAIEIETPLLDEPLDGAIYLGEERPGERFRMLIAARARGATVKLVSALNADPETGRLSARLTDLPQLPLSRLTMSFDGGPQALLATPLACGEAFAGGSFESHRGGKPETSAAAVSIAAANGSSCSGPPGFAPALIAASSGHAAGRSTAFSMTVVRHPGQLLTRRFAVGLPRGLSAALAGIELCSPAGAASGACPPPSRIGAAVAQVGSGPSPAVLHGDVYAAGAYGTAPFSMAIVFAAAVGPFDLGSTVVRAALRVHPRSGRLSIESDPLPRVVEGVPLRFRSLGLSVDRPGLLRNPTSCDPAAFDAAFESSAGGIATATSPLVVRRCGRLRLRPRFSLRLTGRSRLRRDARPGLRVTTRLRSRDTNLRAMRIALPRALGFDISGLREICSRRDAVDGLCSARARVGSARARTPMLGEPLKGAIYVVQPQGDGLPDLWIGLAARGLRVDVRGRTLKRRGRIFTSLVGLPDVPLSRFTMRLRGGKRGVLSLRTGVCGRRDRKRLLASPLVAKGQNGVRRTLRPMVSALCARTGSTRDG